MKSIKNILVATDFSDCATRALKYAVELGRSTEAKLFILHAYRIPGGTTGTPYPMTGMYADTVSIQEQMAKEVKQSLEELERLHLKGQRVRYELISTCNFPEEAIEEAISENNIDLVVMGNRGESSLERLLGSTTTHLMRQTRCPLLAVPEDAVFNQVSNILFATDYQRVDQREAFQGLIALAQAFRARIDVLHIAEESDRLDSNKLSVGESLDRALRPMRHSYHHQQAEDVIEGLRKYLERHEEVGILAVMPRDHSFWERLTQRSVSSQVVFEADRPVLAFRG